jgi:NAD(P)-dependent dehydrogenase (short-subunit alcohol dehydrogenase family)
MNTQSKIAIVTGGGSGIGLAIAEKFVQHNIFTIIVGRNTQKLTAAKEMLGPMCEAVTCDLNDFAALPRLVKDIIEKHGHIDILVNNAGINMKKEFTDVTDEDFQQVLHTNVTAVFIISREVIRHMLKSNIKGSIINISSMASQYGIPKVIAYTASKSAIEGMTRAMATELSPKGSALTALRPALLLRR